MTMVMIFLIIERLAMSLVEVLALIVFEAMHQIQVKLLWIWLSIILQMNITGLKKLKK